ncbi:MAG: hypothetical protein Q4D96_09595 [Propionibacteriaceae bacterium]|nr:hypothetical protein [Propionibacteriaceae bacterium]
MTSLSVLEDWLRRNGLPHMVPGRRRLLGLVPRTTAILVVLLLWGIAAIWTDSTLSTDTAIAVEDLVEQPEVALALTGIILLTLLAIPLGVLTAWVQRHLPLMARLGLTIVVWGLWLAGLSILAAATRDMPGGSGFHFAFWERLLLLAGAVLLAWLDFGAIIAWTTKRSLKEIMAALPAVARTLPLLLLTVLLAFFTNELWQIGAGISKTRMTALGLFLIVLTFLVILPTSIDMVDDEDSDAEHAALLEQSPFAGLTPSPSRLRIGERINLVLVAVAVQAVQIFVFVALTFTMFAIVGVVTLTPELIQEWSGKPSEPLTMLGIRLGMDHAMFRVCLILALFSGVSFAASTLTDELYRTLFLSRVAEEVRRSIAARHRYRTALAAQGKQLRWHALLMAQVPRQRRQKS